MVHFIQTLTVCNEGRIRVGLVAIYRATLPVAICVDDTSNVCVNPFGKSEASVACKDLGFSSEGKCLKSFYEVPTSSVQPCMDYGYLKQILSKYKCAYNHEKCTYYVAYTYELRFKCFSYRPSCGTFG